MQTIYIGVDFHARQQTICYLKTEIGELVTCDLKQQDKQKVRPFYAEFRGQVIVGLEASGYIGISPIGSIRHLCPAASTRSAGERVTRD